MSSACNTFKFIIKSSLIVRRFSIFNSVRMPEGPELNLSSKYINTVCKNKIFSGSVVKSVENAKNPEIDWNKCQYSIYAESRGKELRLTLSTIESGNAKNRKSKRSTKEGKQSKSGKELKIVFNFGMSGRFNYCEETEMVKHSHLTFFTSDSPPMILSFVDVRRFGRWRVDDNWAPDRGPCVMLEYQSFRQHVLENLDKTAFNKPICEVLLNQSYFNGIGNYLRAEILYRTSIRPFDKARDVLQELVDNHGSVKQKPKKESKPDILQLCNKLCHEVINLGATIYNPVPDADYSKFTEWLQCFYKDGMLNMVDHNKRTIWYSGDPGPLVPKEIKRKGLNMHYKKHKDTESNEEESPTKKPKVTTEKLVKPKVEKEVKIKKQRKKRVTRTTLKAEFIEEPDMNGTVTQKIKKELLIEPLPVKSDIKQEPSESKILDSSTSQMDASEILTNDLVEKLSRVKAKMEGEKKKGKQTVQRKKNNFSKLMRKRKF